MVRKLRARRVARRTPRFSSYGLALAAALAGSAAGGCSNPVTPTPTRSVEIVFDGLVTLAPGMPASAQPCITGVLTTRVHPSWRDYVAVPMTATLTLDRWHFTFTDVPVDETVRFRINDKNWCDRNATGAVLGNVTANGVALSPNATTPGPAGDEPGFAFTVNSSGQVRQ